MPCPPRTTDAPKPPTEGRLAMDDEFGGQGRPKRSPIPPSKAGALNVETLVVADRKMVEKHGRENVTTYVLTVMNMVSRGGGVHWELWVRGGWRHHRVERYFPLPQNLGCFTQHKVPLWGISADPL